MKRSPLLLLVPLALAAACARKGPADGGRVSYNFHVRPILSDRCFACHGPDEKKRQAHLRLDLREAATTELRDRPGVFAIVPGRPEESELVKRVSSDDPAYRMPTPESHLAALTADEISILKKWIAEGAEYEKHWAFTPPEKAPLPEISGKNWARNEVDFFTKKKMEEHGLEPSEEAAPAFLLKRLSLDLTGLPPAPEETEAFEAAFSEKTFEEKADELLASPAFGEKMALMWLDIARYADSYGYQDDNLRTQWPWRDWVIAAFNRNLPYDQFLTWQLAGDLLPSATKEQVLATAFLRNHKMTEEGGVIPEEYRVEYHADKVKTVTKGLLALTVECAQCHDHKFDPISQRDYYGLFGFFNQSMEKGFEGDVSVSRPAKPPVLTISEEDRRGLLSFLNKKDTSTAMVSVMGDTARPRPTFVLDRGRYDLPKGRVMPSAPGAVMPFDTTALPQNRLGLARWATDRRNPLTARVFVNHVWQEVFGQGLVRTPGDFGMQGALPTHPELLDWLAVDFMENGWDVKRLVKQLVMSATYRQSAAVSKKALETDPDNLWLARAPRLRLKAELVRDLVLASSGLLNREVGGPSAKPYQPPGLWEGSTSGRGLLRKYEQGHGAELYRRGLYTFVKLTSPPPAMAVFDASNRDQCEVKRPRTSTPLQALVMLNDPTVLEASRFLAQKLLKKGGPPRELVETAFRTIICRKPSARELSILMEYHDGQHSLFSSKKKEAERTVAVGEQPIDRSLDAAELAALMRAVATIYNMEEAIVRC